MKRPTIIFCLFFMFFGYSTCIMGQTIDEKIETLIGEMSLKEKVGQMMQIAVDGISVGQPYNLTEPHQIDPDKLQKVIVEYGTGSILNVGGHSYTREHWREIHEAIQSAVEKTRLKIPIIYGIDAVHGLNYTMGATLFPQEIGQAATWNPSIVEHAAAITAYECRASGLPWNFSPVLDLMRQPLWSRTFETLGEDVFLAKTMSAAMIRGYEGDDISDKEKVAACMKHFLGYSYPFSGKDRTPAYMGLRQIKEYFVPSFQAAIDQGCKTIMICSGEINGIPVHANSYLLNDLLRDEMGFEGFAVSDWEDIIYLHTRHRIAKDIKEAVKIAINAGIDMSMVPMELSFADYLYELVEEGEVSMGRINEAVRRILKVKFELGLFDAPLPDFDYYTHFGSKDFAEISLQAARESMTLLKNQDQTMPIPREAKVLITGPAAHSLNMLNGGWTHVWQGNNPQYVTPGKMTILDAARSYLGEKQVSYVPGSTPEEIVDIKATVREARKADYIIACLGEKPSTEKPGDIESLDLPEAQQELINALAQTGKPIILVLVEARPRIIRKIEPLAKGVLMAYLPSDEGGKAIIDALFGEINPSGKLPFTYPRYANSLLTYDHKHTEDFDINFGTNAFQPQYEFGFGLSYTTFEYGGLKLDKKEIWGDEAITISVTVKNTGDRAGKEVVQLYVRDMYASITPPVKKLRGFQKISLNAGESKVVQFQIRPKDLAFVGIENKWITESGEFEVMVGGMTETFMYRE